MIKDYLQSIQYSECKNGKECFGIFKNKKRIISIGDIHGDFDLFLTSLIKAKVINKDKDSKLIWIGGETIVVQMGDILDRGGRTNSIETNDNEELLILKSIEDIDNKAREHGGRLLTLIGNHEIMNLLGNFNYTTENTRNFFDVHINGTKYNRKSLFEPGGKLANKLAELAFGILKVNDWVFVHAGFFPKYLRQDATLEENFEKINQLVKKIFRKEIEISNLNYDEKNLIFNNEGIFWTRKFSELGFNCNDIESQNLQFTPLKLNKGGIVVGHTAQMNGIRPICNKRIWFVDHAVSKAFGNTSKDKVEVLEITYDDNGDEKIKVLK